jgi:outer membrane protein
MLRHLLVAVTITTLAVAPLGATASAPAPSTTSAPLDLRGCVAYALDHSATILAKKATVAMDNATFTEMRAAELPPVTGQLQNQLQKSANSQGAFAEFGILPQNVFSQNTAQIMSSWTAYNGSANQIQAQQAKRQLEGARDDLRHSQDTLARDVTNAYFLVVARQENVQLQTVNHAYEQALLDVARAREHVGRAPGVDVLRAHADELRALATLVTARSDALTAQEMLAQTIGAPPDTPFLFPTDVPEPAAPTTPLDTMIGLALANRSDISNARDQVAYAQLSNSLIDTDLRPVIALNGSFGNQNSPTSTAFEQALEPNIPIPRGTVGFWQIGATETLTVGLIDYGARAAKHHAARAQIDADVANLEAAEHGVETDVRQALRGVQTTSANLATEKEAALYGAESARIAQLQYKNGLISLTDATQAEQTNVSNANDLVNARVNYVEAIVQLRVAIGAQEPLAIVDVRNP